jgi:hypothetical protein
VIDYETVFYRTADTAQRAYDDADVWDDARIR